MFKYLWFGHIKITTVKTSQHYCAINGQAVLSLLDKYGSKDTCAIACDDIAIKRNRFFSSVILRKQFKLYHLMHLWLNQTTMSNIRSEMAIKSCDACKSKDNDDFGRLFEIHLFE